MKNRNSSIIITIEEIHSINNLSCELLMKVNDIKSNSMSIGLSNFNVAAFRKYKVLLKITVFKWLTFTKTINFMNKTPP